MDVQHLILVGRATKDSELLDTKKDKKFAVFTLAVNRYMGKDKEDEATFYDCMCFLPSADKLVDKIKKGDRVLIQGRPSADAYINKDNEAVGKIKVVIESWEVLK